MKYEEINELSKKYAESKLLQSNYIYDYKSCYDSYNDGINQALTKFRISKHIYYRDIIFTAICGILLGLLISYL